eukprot:m.155669 g.155669  ORF g.155669 m.155669 type:complete len:499 (-) comp10205_c0_seq3:626-2122(-)
MSAGNGPEPMEDVLEDGNASPADVLHWLQMFRSWPQDCQEHALGALVAELKTSVTGARCLVRFSEALRPHLQVDFITQLPEELRTHIFSFLDAPTLLRAAQVSRSWHQAARSDWLWRAICREENVRIPPQIRPHLADLSCIDVYTIWKRLRLEWRAGNAPIVNKAGHTSVITCLALADYGRVISGSDDNNLIIWSLLDAAEPRTLAGHAGGVWCCATSGDLVVSGSTDRTLRVWNLNTGQCLHTLSGHSSTVRCVRMIGTRVVSGSRDATVRVWDFSQGTESLLVLRGHTDAVRCVDFDERFIVSGSYDSLVCVWNATTGERIHCMAGHQNRIYSMQYNGRIVATGSLDMTIKIFDVEHGICLHTLHGHQSLTGIMELRDNILVSGNADSTIRIWDVSTGQCLHTLNGHASAVTCLTFDDEFICSCSDDGTVKLWDLQTGQFIRNLVNLQGADGADQRVVWRIKCTDTHMVCAVGGHPGDATLMMRDFLTPVMNTLRQ